MSTISRQNLITPKRPLEKNEHPENGVDLVKSRVELVELVEKPAAIDARIIQGRTALSMAKRAARAELKRILDEERAGMYRLQPYPDS